MSVAAQVVSIDSRPCVDSQTVCLKAAETSAKWADGCVLRLALAVREWANEVVSQLAPDVRPEVLEGEIVEPSLRYVAFTKLNAAFSPDAIRDDIVNRSAFMSKAPSGDVLAYEAALQAASDLVDAKRLWVAPQ